MAGPEEGDLAGQRETRVLYNLHNTCGAWHIMAATAGSKELRRLSIWPERTDAHVGVRRDRSCILYSY
jgi:hypothetical protein